MINRRVKNKSLDGKIPKIRDFSSLGYRGIGYPDKKPPLVIKI